MINDHKKIQQESKFNNLSSAYDNMFLKIVGGQLPLKKTSKDSYKKRITKDVKLLL
jgi:hypothetical protein